MSTQFYTYENNFLDLTERVNNICCSFENLSKDKKENALEDANNMIQEAKNILVSMELESDSSQTKKQLRYKTKKYESELNSLQFQFEAIQSKYCDSKASEALMVDISDDSRIHEKTLNKRQKLISNEDLYWESGQKMDSTLRKVHEMERNGNNIVFDLESNSNSMRSVVTNLDEVDSQQQISSSLINKMLRRVRMNRMITASVSAFLALVLLYVLFN